VLAYPHMGMIAYWATGRSETDAAAASFLDILPSLSENATDALYISCTLKRTKVQYLPRPRGMPTDVVRTNYVRVHYERAVLSFECMSAFGYVSASSTIRFFTFTSALRHYPNSQLLI